MGQEYILQPQLFESHVSFLSSNSMTAKNINTTTVLASALSAEYVFGRNFSSGTSSVSASFTGVYYGWGWELEGVDKGQPGVNTWVRANSSVAIGFNTLSAKNVYGDFIGTPRFKTLSAATITTNTLAGSSTFHGVYYGDGWNLQGVDRGQPGVNAWVRANSSTAIGFDTLSAKNIYGNFIGSQTFKNTNSVVIATNTAAGSSTFHGVFYGDGRNLLGVSPDQPEINAWVRANSAVETIGSFWVDVSAGSAALAQEWSKTVYGNGRFISICYNTEIDNIAVSVDGKNWSTVTCPVTALTDVVYGNGLFVAVADSTAPIPTKQIATSIDGVNWASNTCYSANWQSVAYGNGYFIAVSNDGYGYWSKDGKTWQNVLLPLLSWKSVCYTDNGFKIIGSDLVGTDIETYILTINTQFGLSTVPIFTSLNMFVTPWYNNNITYNDGIYILTSDDTTDKYYTSIDSVNWVQRTLPVTGTKKRCAYGDGLFIITVNKPTAGTFVYASKDGNSWNEKYQTNTTTTTIHSIGYGNGMFIAGSTSKMDVTGRLRTPNEPLINARHGDSIQYGNKNITGKLTVADLSANSSSVSFVVENGGELQKRFLDLNIVPQYTFTKDLSVSLGNGKSFGRYLNGSVIPAIGKTAPQIIELSLIEPITPDASLAYTGGAIPFAQTNLSNNLTLTHKICSLGATVDLTGLTKIEYSRDNTTWVTISTFNATPNTPSVYTHIFVDPQAYSGATNLAGTNVIPYYYKYTVTDTVGATRTVTANATPVVYQKASNIPTALTTTRYKGDIVSTYTGTLTRNNTVNVPLSTWRIQRNVSSGGYTDIGSLFYFGGATPATSAISFTDNDPTIVNATNVAYRLTYTDTYLTSNNHPAQIATNSTTSTVNFVHRNAIFYNTNPTVTIADVDAVPIVGSSASVGAILSDSKARNNITPVSPPANAYTYYVYNASQANLTSIVLDGATGILGAFTQLADITGTNLHGATVTYKVYKSNAQGAFTAQMLTFA